MALLSIRDRAAALSLLEEVTYVELSDRATSTTASSTSSASSPAPIEIVACGALAGHIREIAARRGWPVKVRPIAAALHNRPQQIKSHAERELATPETQGSRAVLAYADCGTYGALDKLPPRSASAAFPACTATTCTPAQRR